MFCLCHYGPALLEFWFQTDFGSENSASFFKSTGGEDLILPWSRVGHALRPIFMLWLQPRRQGFSLKWVGREKALASAGHVHSLNIPEKLIYMQLAGFALTEVERSNNGK